MTGPEVRVIQDLDLPRVLGPVERSAIMMNVPYIKPGSPFQEHPNGVEMTGQRGLMQRCGMGVAANRIVPVRVLTRFKK